MDEQSPDISAELEAKRKRNREAQKLWRERHPEQARAINTATKRKTRQKRRAALGLSSSPSAKTRVAPTTAPSFGDASAYSPPTDPFSNSSPITLRTPSKSDTGIEDSPIRHVESKEEALALAGQAGRDLVEFGQIRDPFVREILARGQIKRKRFQHDEALYHAVKDVVKTVFGENRDRVAEATGMTRSQVNSMLRITGNYKEPRLQEHQIQKEIEIQESIYSGRKDLIEEMLETGARYVRQARDTVAKTHGLTAAKSAAILLDKALLFAGQPTSRVSRVDERMMSSEDLEKKLLEYNEMLARTDLKVIQGGQKGL